MKDLKKTLKIAGIVCLVETLFCIISLLLDIFVFEFETYNVVGDAVDIALSTATGTIFLIFMQKPTDEIVKNRTLFVVLLVLNIFNNIVVWAMSFWVEIVVSNRYRIQMSGEVYKKFMSVSENDDENENSENNNDEEENSEVVIVDGEEYNISKNKQTLTERLEELENLRNKKLISQEEYMELREEAILKFMN